MWNECVAFATTTRDSSGCRRLLQLVLEKVGSGGYLPVHCKGVSSAAAIVPAPLEPNVSFGVEPILTVLQAVPEGPKLPPTGGLVPEVGRSVCAGDGRDFANQAEGS